MEAKKISLRFILMYIGVFTAQIIFFGFWPSIMRMWGYTDTFTGFASAFSTATGMVFSLALGFVMDKYHCPRLLVPAIFSFYALMLVLAFALKAPAWFMYLFYALAAGTVGLTTSFSEMWNLKLTEEVEGLTFSKVRSFGSMAYAFAGLVAGRILEKAGAVGAAYIVLGAWLFIVPNALCLPNPRKREEEGEKVRFLPQLRELLKNKGFVLLAVCTALNLVSNNAVSGYLSVIIMDLGGTSFQSGIALFVLAITEFVIMYFFAPLGRRFTVKKLMIFGIFVTALRAVLISLARSPWTVVALASLNAISFGLTAPAGTLLLNGTVDPRFTAASMQVLSAVCSVFSIIMSPVLGIVSDTLGIPSMLRIFSVFSLISLGIIFLHYRDFPDVQNVN